MPATPPYTTLDCQQEKAVVFIKFSESVCWYRISPQYCLAPGAAQMESTFTRDPDPVGNSETYWSDNLDFEKEYAKEWSGDEKLKLPLRKTTARFPHVPDYEDPDFDATSTEGMRHPKHNFSRSWFIANMNGFLLGCSYFDIRSLCPLLPQFITVSRC